MKKEYDKLIRDQIPKILKEKEIEFLVETYKTDEEFHLALKEKLLEEVNEFLEEPSTEELVDIIDVIYELKKFYPDFYDVSRVKAETRGRFHDRLKLLWTKES
jgi:predicted house-cleaning noncanonical NTP pyrophosphatase (MazG superfamily)